MQTCQLLIKHNQNPSVSLPVSIMEEMITSEGVNMWLFKLFELEKHHVNRWFSAQIKHKPAYLEKKKKKS